MTDKALLIAALRQCADRLEYAALSIKGVEMRRSINESVREYRQLADLCEGRPDAEEKPE